MGPKNRLAKNLSKLDLLPGPLPARLRSLAMGSLVPFVGTAGLAVEEMTPERVVVVLPNRRRVRNHIGGVHAAAMTLLAETATGFVVGMNVPDSALPLMKSLKVDFKKRAQGSLRATATLTEAQREELRSTEKGEVAVEVHCTDESGAEPILCEMVWAWVPKKR